jgi:hypothetical protein
MSLITVVTVYSREAVLPFSIKVSERTENLPTYVSPHLPNLYNSNPNFHVGWGIDSPIGHVIIDGEVWVIFNSGNQYGTEVQIARFKGSDFEHTVRQEDGIIKVEKDVSTHFLGGLWYDRSTGTLYAPIHCEYARNISPPAGWSRKKTRLAVSTDKGLTWQLAGDILTDCLPDDKDWLKFSGSFFQAGPGDMDFFADSLGGYFYIYSCNAYAPKNGKMNNYLWFNEVARCAMADKMAPGKWRKFCNGEWTEPGLAGKSSKVAMDTYGIYGRVIYCTYLKKYLRIGPCLGVADGRYSDTGFDDGSIYVSVCADLARQQWSPKVKLFDKPGNKKLGITVSDGQARDPFVCDAHLRIYNYWLYDLPSSALDVTLTFGTTAVAEFPPYGSYAYEPLPESGDPMVSRQTRMVGCENTDLTYGGEGWSCKNNARYYQGEIRECRTPGNSLKFSWQGDAIYWRAVADSDGGKVDIYIDDQFQETVDCYYKEALPFQFAFIKTGLANKTHAILIKIRADRHPQSKGTVIRHMAFEYPAESFRASAGFSSVMGKNNWHYRQREGTTYRNLDFLYALIFEDSNKNGKERFVYPNSWGDKETSIIGNNYQIAIERDAVRTWIAPHSGKIRIESLVAIEKDGKGAVSAAILQNDKILWRKAVKFTEPVAHDLTCQVDKGDAVNFIVKKSAGDRAIKVIWDPVITLTPESDSFTK